MGLVAAYHAAGRFDAAMQAAQALLSRHGLGGGGGMAPTLAAIARQTGLPGWAALRSDGRMIAQLLAPPVAAEDVRLRLDGRMLRVRPRATGSARVPSWRLPSGWHGARELEATIGGVALLGCPIEVGRIAAVEGFVEAHGAALRGWAWSPNNPDLDPLLRVTALDRKGRTIEVVASDQDFPLAHDRPLARPRGFLVPASDLAGFDGLIRVAGRDGRDLMGSPLDPSAEQHAAAFAAAGDRPRSSCGSGVRAREREGRDNPFRPSPSRHRRPPCAGGRDAAPVDVVIPVYRGLAATLACLDAVLADLPAWARAVAVDDHTPEPELAAALDDLAALGRIHLLRHIGNRGFPAAANTGMRSAPDRDVVLLNSDTLVPPGWLSRLRVAAYSAGDIGTASPFSNNATILSYPVADRENPTPGIAGTIALDALAAKVNGDGTVDLPTAVGFCMYVKRDCLDDVGLFREDMFAQGYGEENDFSIRARHLGWRHVAATGVFVAHAGGVSFGTASRYLIERNSAVLARLHPGYGDLIGGFRAADALAPARRRLDEARWAAARDGREARLVIAGAADGAHASAAAAGRVIRLLPDHRDGGRLGCRLDDAHVGPTPHLRFALPGEIDRLADFLRPDRPVMVEIISLAEHDASLATLSARLGIPHEIKMGEYSWFCPRISLLGAENRYCGEPDVAGCEDCIADAGSRLASPLSLREWRAVSRQVLAAAARIEAPSQDAARRLRRHFPVAAATVTVADGHGPIGPDAKSGDGYAGMLGRVCVLGANSTEGGYDVALAVARDAGWRSLPIEYVFVGETFDDRRLLATGRAFVTGPAEAGEMIDLIRAQRAAFAFLPSQLPHPRADPLEAAWAAGLDAACFDIGTTAERVRRAGRGWLLPLGAPTAAINNRLLGIMRQIAQRERQVVGG